MPLPASLLAWRSLYEVDGRMIADLVRVTPWGGTRVIAGGSVPILRADDLAPVAEDAARVRSVVRRFTTFADGWVAYRDGDATAIGDMRFSLDPGFRPPWLLRLGKDAAAPAVAWEQGGFDTEDAGVLLAVILGTAEGLRPLP